MLRLLVIGWFVVVAHAAHADTVALLPLDGDRTLEMYGKPVATEIARALEANGIDVVVVDAKMEVPDRARLIVDGTIKADKKGKSDQITLVLRVRDPRDGTVLDQLAPASAPLDEIDRAAAELSTRIVPSVKTHLAALARTTTTPPREAKPVPPRPPVQQSTGEPRLVVALSAPLEASGELLLLRYGLQSELEPWVRTHHRALAPIDPAALAAPTAPSSVSTAGSELGLALHVLGFAITPGAVPLARARVRMRIIDTQRVLFERTIVTDTIVGDRKMTEAQFAARAAQEVLRIVHPQFRRVSKAWK